MRTHKLAVAIPRRMTRGRFAVARRQPPMRRPAHLWIQPPTSGSQGDDRRKLLRAQANARHFYIFRGSLFGSCCLEP
jgi:hypothetical protein